VYVCAVRDRRSSCCTHTHTLPGPVGTDPAATILNTRFAPGEEPAPAGLRRAQLMGKVHACARGETDLRARWPLRRAHPHHA
jgi:hypothetical protein